MHRDAQLDQDAEGVLAHEGLLGEGGGQGGGKMCQGPRSCHWGFVFAVVSLDPTGQCTSPALRMLSHSLNTIKSFHCT